LLCSRADGHCRTQYFIDSGTFKNETPAYLDLSHQFGECRQYHRPKLPGILWMSKEAADEDLDGTIILNRFQFPTSMNNFE
jgi:hypothetical protein